MNMGILENKGGSFLYLHPLKTGVLGEEMDEYFFLTFGQVVYSHLQVA